jgi:hypothetical protein
MRICVSLLLVIGLTACQARKPKAGDPCKIADDKTTFCSDAKTALVCQAGKRIEIQCRGAKGCAGGENATCDTSLAKEGDACIAASDYVGGTARVCSEDRASLLRCTEGKLEVDLRCRGAKGCDPAVSHLEHTVDYGCDRTIGEVGDACNTRGSAHESLGACSADKKSVVVCDKDQNGKLVTSKVCAGPKGCRVGHLSGSPDLPAPVCDRGSVVAGARCGKNDAAECSTDGTELLTCDQATAKYVSKPCPPKEHCAHPEGMVAWCSAKATRARAP